MERFEALRSLTRETVARLQRAGEVDPALPADYCAGALLSVAVGGALSFCFLAELDQSAPPSRTTSTPSSAGPSSQKRKRKRPAEREYEKPPRSHWAPGRSYFLFQLSSGSSGSSWRRVERNSFRAS